MILAAITTCRRNPEMLERAIKSVIAQTYTDWNLVVIDDSPADYALRDDVRKLIEGYGEQDSRIRYVPHDTNKGVSAARNTALKLAEEEGIYEAIAYLDDDDEWLPEKMKLQAEKLNECGENTALVYCDFYMFDDIKGTSREIRKSFSGDNIRQELMRYNVIGSPSFVLVRTKCLSEVGGFDVELTSGEEWDVWVRILEHYDAAYVNMPLVNYHLGHAQRIEPKDKAIAEAARVRRDIRETLHILEKNSEYFARNKYAQWIKLSGLAASYRKNGEIAKSFKTLLKAISVQPSRVLGNLKILLEIFIPVNVGLMWKIKEALNKIFPDRFYWFMSSCYRKMMRKFF